MYRYFIFLADSLLPSNFLGDKNKEILCCWLADYIFVLNKDRYEQRYPTLLTRRRIFLLFLSATNYFQLPLVE